MPQNEDTKLMFGIYDTKLVSKEVLGILEAFLGELKFLLAQSADNSINLLERL